jgi:hypothetical protein
VLKVSLPTTAVNILAKAARSLLHRSKGLLSYFDHGIDNGKAEDINNNSPYVLSRRVLSGTAQGDPPIVSKSIVRSLLMREDRRISAGIGQKAPPPKCVR